MSNDEDIEVNEQQFMLLQMMYTNDINAGTAMKMLGISMEQLEKIINELLQNKILKISGDKEVELTDKDTEFIVELMKKKTGGALKSYFNKTILMYYFYRKLFIIHII